MENGIIKIAEEKEHQEILDILNQAINERRFTALLTPVTLENRRRWFEEHDDLKHPIFIYKEGDRTLGWMAISVYRDGREGFQNTCEISYYIDKDHRGKGIASKLLDKVMDYSKDVGINNLMAVVFADNTYSKKLLKSNGFTEWGRFPNIVEIDNITKDCLQFGRCLNE